MTISGVSATGRSCAGRGPRSRGVASSSGRTSRGPSPLARPVRRSPGHGAYSVPPVAVSDTPVSSVVESVRPVPVVGKGTLLALARPQPPPVPTRSCPLHVTPKSAVPVSEGFHVPRKAVEDPVLGWDWDGLGPSGSCTFPVPFLSLSLPVPGPSTSCRPPSALSPPPTLCTDPTSKILGDSFSRLPLCTRTGLLGTCDSTPVYLIQESSVGHFTNPSFPCHRWVAPARGSGDSCVGH